MKKSHSDNTPKHRSAVTGQYVPERTAKRNPRETVTERDRSCKPPPKKGGK